MGAERLLDNLLTFLSPYPHTPYHHLAFEVAPPWSITISPYTKKIRPCKCSSCMPSKTNCLSKKGSSSLIPTPNQSELITDVVPVFCPISRTSSDPSKIQTKPSKDSLGLEQTTPRLAHYVGSGWMIREKSIPSKSPIHTMSPNVN